MSRIRIVFLALFTCCAYAYSEGVFSREICTKLKEMYSQLEDYQCRMRITSYNNKNECETRINNYYFKKQRNIRMDIIKGTRFMDDGSVGVFRGGTVVNGRIGIFAVTVSKSDSLVTTNRGAEFDESDLRYIIEKISLHVHSGEITVNEYGDTIEVIMISHSPERNRGITHEVIELDSNTLLPLKAKSYADSRLVQDVEWSRFIINSGLPDELFDVWYDPARLKSMGIDTVHVLK